MIFLLLSGAEYIFSSTGQRLLRYDGYTFLTNNENSDKARWLCYTHCDKGCDAYLITLNDVIIRLKNDHSHLRSDHQAGR